MLSRAMAAAKAGYGSLLYDSRSHGTSGKSIVSLGYYEKNDVLGAIRFIENRCHDCDVPPKIVLMGISMGAVATLEARRVQRLFCSDSRLSVSSLKETTDHAWLFSLPRYPFAPLFVWFQRLPSIPNR
jgi:hypothetical protein